MNPWHLTGAALAVALVALSIVLAIEAARRHRRRKNMGTTSPHLTCSRPGKFDCEHDAELSASLADGGDVGEGHVESTAAWFAEVTLDPVAEHRVLEHYGVRWLIARENSQGFFWVEVYETEQARDERLEGLRAAHAEWDTGVL